MSLFEKLNENRDNTTKRDLIILELIKDLMVEVKGITELSESELKAISLIKSDGFLSDLLRFYESSKKHGKRKYSKEIIEIFKEMAKIMTASSDYSKSINERGV